ncbi:indolepyruvate oxidoreductase subunit beta [Alkalibaculum sp. M08DMB]|uniref:Indolepyruvate oxidoreductase subunit beta n=1 Tax=Alkalibaculum sporogenes TaxID=2655001 RepID=A0A6A7K878_9FIRM|nr:indolepyruvate oxidoreductase subunit beta [Alkalibaculum sporogenes]MPW25688.1 indolepyruvate oxidoreductase subunit beta [Alkalibaculum sporogenes]
MTKNILLVGVGGQGTILASKLLTLGLMEAGYDVKMNEIHGMSQRGGSVSSQIRYGDKVESPVIELGGADILVSFEKMEALRWLSYLKPDGRVVVNNYEINPMPVLSGKSDYSKDIIKEIESKVSTAIVDAANKAIELGNAKVMNVIMLGSIIKLMNLEEINWDKILEENVKAQFIDLNMKALKVGIDLV